MSGITAAARRELLAIAEAGSPSRTSHLPGYCCGAVSNKLRHLPRPAAGPRRALHRPDPGLPEVQQHGRNHPARRLGAAVRYGGDIAAHSRRGPGRLAGCTLSRRARNSCSRAREQIAGSSAATSPLDGRLVVIRGHSDARRGRSWRNHRLARQRRIDALRSAHNHDGRSRASRSAAHLRRLPRSGRRDGRTIETQFAGRR